MERRSGSRFATWWTGLVTALVIVLLAAVPGDTPGASSTLVGVQAAARHDAFNMAVWEAVHLLDLLPRRPPQGGTEAVDRYYRLADALRATEAEVARRLAVAGTSDDPRVVEALAERHRLRREMERVEPQVHRQLQSMVGETLRSEGLVLDLPLLGPRLFPPLAFTLDELPYVLVVSPRDKIELLETIAIRPDVTEVEMEAMEGALRRRGLSAVVEPLGGLSTYPAIVKSDASLRHVLSIIAHEWTHHYLFFRPLGQRHGASGAMATINETVADMVGDEVAALVLGEPPPALQQSVRDGPPPKPEGSDAFSVNRFLRETRLAAERMLSEGRLEDAEAYMEERRRELMEHGVFLRVLNQAYFAFHGTYGDSPVSVSPVFGQLLDVRRAEPSLGAFLRRVQGITAPAELAALAEAAAPASSTP